LLPWFGLGAAAGLFSGWVERTYIGAQGAGFSLSILQRCLVAGREIWFYLGKLLWPANLIFIYPHWSVDAGAGWQWLFPLGAIALLAALWLVRGRTRAPLAALLLFVGTLFPTLGFFNVYAFLFSYVADHWQYLASLGIIALAAAGWGYLPRRPARIGAGVLLAGMGVLSWGQCRMYDNVETFYRTILDRNPGAWMAHDNLGVVLARSGRLPEAITHYQEALRLKPDSAEIYHDLGTALTQAGRLPEAVADYEQALRLQPGYAAAHYHLGSVLARMGRMEEAVGQFEQALQIKPDDAEAQNNLGSALAMLNRMPEATEHFAAAVRLDPDSAQARCNLGKALAQQGRIPEAIEQFRAALRLDPVMAEAREILRQLQGSALPQN
jgi:tetratricopeptide (TPR) repeat protein